MLNSERVRTSPAALDCIRGELDRLFEPPSIDAQALREAIAIKFQLPVGCIAVGNGSTELMNILAKTHQDQNREIIISSPSFMLYEYLARLYSYRLNVIPLDGYRHDLVRIQRSSGEGTRIIFLDSPTNVTGCAIDDADFLAFLDDLHKETIVVYDNVYAEYQDKSSDPLIRRLVLDHPSSVLVCRSFSKAHCLFGLRVGYMLGKTDLIEPIRRHVMPFNLGSLSQSAAITSLRDEENVARNVSLNDQAKKMVCASLRNLGIAYVPTQSNALLVNFGNEIELVEAYLAQRGIRVRGQIKCGIPGHIQVFLIDPFSVQSFIETIEEYFRRKRS